MLNCTTCERFDGHKCLEFGHLIGMAICPYAVEKKPKTHGDEIRAMTDEELAEKIATVFDCDHHKCPVERNKCHQCVESWLDFLRQPVKEVMDNDR